MHKFWQKKEDTELKQFAQPKGNEDVTMWGIHAKNLLENPAFEEAIRRQEREYFNQWRNSKPMETDERESVWMQYESLQKMKLKLVGMVNDMVMEKEKQSEEATSVMASPEGD